MAPGDRSAYPRFPSMLSTRDLTTRYTPSAEEIQWCQSMARGTPLQHAALVFLKCFQQLHYFPEPSDIPGEIQRHIAEIIGFERPGLFDVSSATRYRQQAAIRRYLGITPFYGKEGRRLATRAAMGAAPVVTQRIDLINAIIEELLRCRVELPAYSTLIRVAEEVSSAGDTELVALIDRRLTMPRREALEELIRTEFDRGRTAFDQLKRLPKRPSRDHVDALITQGAWLERFGEVEDLFANIPVTKVRYFANYAMTLDAGELKHITPPKRYALILAMVHHLRARLRDDQAEMFVRQMATIHKRAKEELETLMIRQRARAHAVVAKFDSILGLVAQTSSDAELGQRVRRLLASGLEHWQEECTALRAWSGGNYLPLLWKHYRTHRAVLLRLVGTLPLQSTAQDQTLLAALQIVLSPAGQRADTLTEPIDLSFASERWRKLVRTGRGNQAMIQRRELEVCVLTHLAASLRAGDLALTGAQSYGDYRQQLLPWTDCEERLPAYCAKVGLPATPRGLIGVLKQELTTLAADVDAAFPTLTDAVTINERGEPVLTRLVAREVPTSAVALERWLTQRLPPRKLLDVLTNIEHWTHFTRHFGPASGTAPKLQQASMRYLQTLFAMGCNLGPTQAARHFTSPVTPHMLSFVHRKHMSVEQLEAAIRELTELYLQLDLPKVWGDGKTVAADGTQYDLYDNNLAVGYHFRYRKMGLVAYRHVADNYIAVFRHFIPPGIWEAVYVIEGLLKAGLSVEPDTVYSDTQGQSTTVFAFTYLLGIQLMPRIRNWKELSFHRPDKAVHYHHIDRLFGEAIAWELIEVHWRELMQVVVSIQAGTINSATLLRKLSYGGPRNKLFLAAQELGRAVRTIFLLKWISQAELRRDVTANTNKIEAYNGFAKWLSFGGDVIPENDPDEQQKRLRYNDLIAACVILQNAVDMTRTLRQRTVEHKPVHHADLAFLSPYGTQHVKRFGEYTLDLAREPEPWLAEPPFRQAVQQVRRQTATSVSSSP